jgi:hypothetical protein
MLFIRSQSYQWLAVAALWAILFQLATAQLPSGEASAGSAEFLERFVHSIDESIGTHYISAFLDLDDHGAHGAVLYITDPNYCGSGGCTMLVVVRQGDSWRLVTRTTVVRPPIRVLESTSHGWHDIGVWVQGGGIQPGYEAILSFNGKTYPENPSVEPARRSTMPSPGRVVIELPQIQRSQPNSQK